MLLIKGWVSTEVVCRTDTLERVPCTPEPVELSAGDKLELAARFRYLAGWRN